VTFLGGPVGWTCVTRSALTAAESAGCQSHCQPECSATGSSLSVRRTGSNFKLKLQLQTEIATRGPESGVLPREGIVTGSRTASGWAAQAGTQPIALTTVDHWQAMH